MNKINFKIILLTYIILSYHFVAANNNIIWQQCGNQCNYPGVYISVNILCNNNKIYTKKLSEDVYKIVDLNSYDLIDAIQTKYEVDYFISSPDEKYYINSRLEVYEFENNKYLRILDTTGIDIGFISDLHFSSDGKYISFIYGTNQLKVFNFNSGKLIFDHYNENRVLDIEIKKNYELIYLDEMGELITFNLISGEKISQINPTSFYYDGYLSLSNSDTLVALTDNNNNNIWVFNILQNKIIDSIKTESDTRAVFSNDDSILIYSDKSELIFKRLENGEIINRVSCTYQPYYIEKSNCGKYLFIHYKYQSIVDIFDLTKKELHPIVCHSGMLLGLAFSKDSKYLYTFEKGGNDTYIQKFDYFSKKREWISPSITEQSKENKFYRHFYPFLLSPDNNYLAVCGQPDSFPFIYIFDLNNSSIYPTFLSGHKKAITSLAFSKNEKYLASGGLDSIIYIWDLENLSLYKTINIKEQVSLLSFKNEDEIYAVTGGVDGGWKVLNLFSITTGEKINIGDMAGFASFFDYRYPITISSNNKFLATNESWGGFFVLDVGTLNWTSKFDSLNIYSLAFSPDEKFLATGLTEPYIKIWDIKNNKVAAQYDYNSFIKIPNLFYVGEPDSIFPPIKSIAFSPDGRFVAGGNDDGSVIIWENTLINVEENQIQKGDITLYPNPATNEFKLRFQSHIETTVQINIFDYLGNKVFSRTEQATEGTNEIIICTEKITSGYYFVKININEVVETVPLLIIK